MKARQPFLNTYDTKNVNAHVLDVTQYELSTTVAWVDWIGCKLEINVIFTKQISLFNPIMGKCYLHLPPEVSNKKAVVNVQNEDNKCFTWCFLARLYSSKLDQK